ncbi:MAG TPA: cbb3-type cytochrome c oxidase subunit I, partial [Armatimonadota bacterium]|nr:cbb3-type cytochrome c oxidase subunit I [Armatimonadota bacterium]
MDITERTSLREILSTWPQTRPVMARYGLLECGGAAGPDEPLGWFARVHRVAPERLLAELREAIAHSAAADTTAPVPAAPTPAAPADDLYRRFLVTAVAFVLTGGVLWGAINLSLIGYHRAFLAWLTVGNQAHGHVQIFGWVALFIMGVAYHVLPRLKATPLRHAGLGYASFWLMAGGVLLHAVYRPFMASPALAPIPVLAGLMELAGILAFAAVVVETLRHGTTPADPSDKYLVTGTLGFVAMGVMNAALLSVMAAQGTAVLPPAWNWAYRHLQLTGFASMFIFGVSLRTLPVFLGKPEINPRLDRLVFPLIVGGFLLRAAGDVLVGTGRLAPAALLLPAAMECVGLLGFIWNLGLFKRTVTPADGMDAAARAYEKFVYAAYGWLLVSVVGIAALTAYHALSGAPAPHALMGSYRHALTVGFITFIILGYAMRVVPVFLGRPVYSARLLNATFALMMVGNTLRVVFQALTVPFGAWPFTVAGLSGWFELVGLALFGYNLLRTIYSPAPPTPCRAPDEAEEEGAP